jgi:DNA repair protein RecO (recombination protein O)
MRIEQQPAFVLHGRNYSETSLLLDIFTRNHGRISVLAKGARRKSSKVRGILNPFQPLLISWIGRSEVYLLTHGEVLSNSIGLKGTSVYCGFYINELLVRLLHRHDPHPHLFDRYQQTLSQLGNGNNHEENLRLFEKKLLQELGYGLVLNHEIRDRSAIDPTAKYCYHLDSGPECFSDDESVRCRDGVIVSGQALLALERECLNEEGVLREIKILMRAILWRYLGGRPLNTRKLLRSLLAVRETSTTHSEDHAKPLAGWTR